MTTHYVAMTIDGTVVPSSAVSNGTAKQCEATAKRLNGRDRHVSVGWVVVPCVTNEVQTSLQLEAN